MVHIEVAYAYAILPLFLRVKARRAKRVLAIAKGSVRLSVRMSHTLCSLIKKMQATFAQSSPWAITKTLAFVTKFRAPAWVRRFLSNEGVKEGYR